MTILEKIKFEEDWLSEVNLTKENMKIALEGIRTTAREQKREQMTPKRYLTDDELNKIRIQEDMLKGNLNRMCVSENSNELIEMYHFAILRIANIFDICLNKYIEESEDNNGK